TSGGSSHAAWPSSRRTAALCRRAPISVDGSAGCAPALAQTGLVDSPMAEAQTTPFTGRTAWGRNLAAPVRDFLSTESGSAAILLAATVGALIWANSPWSSSYESFWTTGLSIRVGGGGITGDLRFWINEGLMA